MSVVTIYATTFKQLMHTLNSKPNKHFLNINKWIFKLQDIKLDTQI